MEYSKNNIRLANNLQCFFVAALFMLSLGECQSQVTMPEKVRVNTVRIHAADHGFGFIVGESNNNLYIVTARHVLFTSRDSGEVVDSADVYFFTDQGKRYKAEVLGTHKVDYDLAVIRLAAPPAFQWERKVLASTNSQKRGTEVWFVGKSDRWSIPALPGAIASEQPSDDSQIEIDGLRVAPGTSGAPLVAKTGIVGMVQTDSEDDTRALTVDAIHRAISGWNYPWNLEEGELSGSDSSCKLPIKSSPAGAKISLEGVPRGVTPTSLSISAGKKYKLKVEKDQYTAFEQEIDCESGEINVPLQKNVGTIQLRYLGDQLRCSLQIKVKVGDRTLTPLSNLAEFANVPLGDQEYSISGQIGCPGTGVCTATGSGTIQVEDGHTYDVAWRNTAYAKCTVDLVE